jgi:hypothetical protein
MITNYNLFEFYTGPYKAVGYKHFKEEGFGFGITTTEEGLENFIIVQEDFFNHLEKDLGFQKFNIFVDSESLSIYLLFFAINQYEAMSIIEEFKKYFDDSEIPINMAAMKTGIDSNTKVEDLFNDSADITNYINRKEIVKKMYGQDIKSDSYKKTKIGFRAEKNG